MTFIDWSDSEGMFGLLLDYVADARAECPEDAERQLFLSELLAQLRATEGQVAEPSPAGTIQELRNIHASVDPEFATDPVMVHLHDCIEELERVERESAH
jgi:hypothetical protein